jgi:hypothetical protein
MLETSDNPFALATLAHLETQNTRQNETRRFESKLRFIRKLITPAFAIDFLLPQHQGGADSKEDKRQEWVISTARYSG